MAQNRHFHMGGGDNAGGMFGDTTYTKIFVGGLAWETQRETMRRYFEQFGEIQEAVIITDKNTGRSKGYGFVRPIYIISNIKSESIDPLISFPSLWALAVG